MESNTVHQRELPLQFEEFYKQYYPRLFSYTYRLCHDQDLAKDALQEVFLRLLEAGDRFRELRDPEAYLRLVLKREVIARLQQRKKRQLQQGKASQLQTVASYESLLLGLEADAERRTQLRKALNDLSKEERKILELKFFREQSYDEIAQSSGKSKRTVYNQVFRALTKLRAALGVGGLLFFLKLF